MVYSHEQGNIGYHGVITENIGISIVVYVLQKQLFDYKHVVECTADISGNLWLLILHSGGSACALRSCCRGCSRDTMTG